MILMMKYGTRPSLSLRDRGGTKRLKSFVLFICIKFFFKEELLSIFVWFFIFFLFHCIIFVQPYEDRVDISRKNMKK